MAEREKESQYARRGSGKKKVDYGVFIKPVVISDMKKYADSNGNTRDREWYNTPLLIGGISKFEQMPTIGTFGTDNGSITYRSYVRSEFERDPNNDSGPVKQKKMKRGLRNVRRVPAKLSFIDYLVTIKFLGVTFERSKDGMTNPKTFRGMQEKVFYSEMPTIKNNKVMMRCQCRDFNMVWIVALAKQNGLWPNSTSYTPYTRLTPEDSGYPVKNPDMRMGYCKHIEAFLTYLIQTNHIGNGTTK